MKVWQMLTAVVVVNLVLQSTSTSYHTFTVLEDTGHLEPEPYFTSAGRQCVSVRVCDYV